MKRKLMYFFGALLLSGVAAFGTACTKQECAQFFNHANDFKEFCQTDLGGSASQCADLRNELRKECGGGGS